jgi:hypothetical protein
MLSGPSFLSAQNVSSPKDFYLVWVEEMRNYGIEMFVVIIM